MADGRAGVATRRAVVEDLSVSRVRGIPLADEPGKAHALVVVERLGVSQTADGPRGVQDDGGRHHGTGQRPAACFVHSRDAQPQADSRWGPGDHGAIIASFRAIMGSPREP